MGNKLQKFLKLPITPASLSLLEKLMVKTHFGGPAKCNVCGLFTLLYVRNNDLKESCKCLNCHATNRQRQMAFFFCQTVNTITGQSFSSLKELAKLDNSGLVVYNTEANGAFHKYLAPLKGYICSEYIGDNFKSGEIVNGVMHQDLRALSFETESIDLFLTSDVFEHVSDPYKAFQEVYRVLKKGGRHIFTVPFNPDQFLDDKRAKVDSDGQLVLLKPPIYHGDPLDLAGGILVYNLFGIEMLVKLAEMNFQANLYQLHSRFYGIFGPQTLVFETIKV